MTILGIETSTAVCSVGLANESGLLAEAFLVESHIHSEKLLTLVQKVCNEQRVSLPHIDGIAVSLGPGSFTGLRIGLSTAKGLSFALGKPLIGVPTFQALAQRVFDVHLEGTRAVVCIDAKQGEYYIGMFEKKDGTCLEILPVHIGGISSFMDLAKGKTVVVTDQREILILAGLTAWKVEDVFSYCRGDKIAAMAMIKIRQGVRPMLPDVEPMYLKDFIVRHGVKPVK